MSFYVTWRHLPIYYLYNDVMHKNAEVSKNMTCNPIFFDTRVVLEIVGQGCHRFDNTIFPDFPDIFSFNLTLFSLRVIWFIYYFPWETFRVLMYWQNVTFGSGMHLKTPLNVATPWHGLKIWNCVVLRIHNTIGSFFCPISRTLCIPSSLPCFLSGFL